VDDYVPIHNDNRMVNVMEELSYHKMKDGSTLTISKKRNGMYEVARYSKSDIEEWSIECSELEAWQIYKAKKEAGNGEQTGK
jgi:hypothetical protein